MMTKRPRRAAIYARISKATEESVSIERQLDSCRRLAEARGWTVVLEATDDGVSATRKRPEERPGFGEILDRLGEIDVVLAWRTDRLVRRVSDWTDLDRRLREERPDAPVYLATVEDSVETVSSQGRAFATILSVFATLEADATSARTRAARPVILRSGRIVGGRVGWPFASVANPDGPGYVLRPIPERAEAIREAAAALVAGRASYYSIAEDWTARGLPTASGGSSWSPTSVRRILRSPTLTGARVYLGSELRDESGRVIRDEAQEILEPSLWRAVIDSERERVRVGGDRVTRLPLLHRLAVCGKCGRHLNVNRSATRATRYVCASPKCGKPRPSILADDLEALVVREWLTRCGHGPLEAWLEDAETDADLVADLEDALADVEDALSGDVSDDDGLRLLATRRDLRSRLAAAQDAVKVSRTAVPGVTLADAWDSTDDDDTAALRDLLGGSISEIVVRPVSRKTGAVVLDRVEIRWR